MKETFVEPVEIALVDDDEMFVEFTELKLQKLGDYSTTTYTRPTEFLDDFGSYGFDGIVSDYEMPHMNGIEVLEEVRNQDEDVPFILFTGKGSEEVASEAISAGVTDYIQKTGDSVQYELLENRLSNSIDRVRSDWAYEAEKDFLGQAVDALPNMFYAIDMYGTPIEWNRRAEEMTGLTTEELQGIDSAELHSDPELVRRKIAETIKEGQIEFETEIQNGNGGLTPIRYSNSLLEINGKNVIVGVGKDITEERREEAWKDTLVKTITHDIGNNLGVIDGYLEILANEINDQRLDAVRDYSERSIEQNDPGVAKPQFYSSQPKSR
jgi:PAS domain S-box-containing protein